MCVHYIRQLVVPVYLSSPTLNGELAIEKLGYIESRVSILQVGCDPRYNELSSLSIMSISCGIITIVFRDEVSFLRLAFDYEPANYHLHKFL